MAATPSREIILFGTEEPAVQAQLLKAGPLTAELDAGNLRYIRYEGLEAIRAIAYLARDRYWGTCNPEIRDLTVEEAGDHFTVTYTAVCADAEQRFVYRARITGSADGSLRFEGTATPDTDFVTNRTGFVVLHAAQGISGHPAVVREVSGRVVETRFPEVIDPKQPIMDIRALTHEVAPGLEVVCTMLGDTFEMEDQRNWTDASYKTYVRPLGLPYPYTLNAGETIEQAVELRFEGTAPARAGGAGTPEITVAVGAQAGPVPRIGMGLEWHSTGAAMARAEELDGLEPAFLSCYFDARHAGAEAMEGFREAADVLGCDLALEAVLPDLEDPDAALRSAADLARAAGCRFASVAVSPAQDLGFVAPGTVFDDMSAYDTLYGAAREAFPGCAIGGGSFMYFTELNRKPPPSRGMDFVTHPTCAIVHAPDDRSVAETVESLPYVIGSVRSLFGAKPYRLGPVAIGIRTSPFGGAPAPNPHGARVAMCRNDPRQRGLLGAAWHMGVAARAAEGGVDSLTLGAPTGDHGLLHHPGETPQPWFDEHGGRFPVWHVMRGMYGASGRLRRATEVSAAREVQALAFETGAGLELWVANLTGEDRRVRLEGLAGGSMRVAVLDEGSFVDGAGDPDVLDSVERSASGDRIDLRPYAVARCRVE